jgi:lipopolysaccharide/colanic/teichoic acid biosynthesis glycosyltransferase
MSSIRAEGIPRWLEAGVATVALLAVLPLLLIIAVAVWVSSRGPVLFRQERVGQHGRGFFMVKFRTMSANAAGPQVTAKGDERVTAVGRLLRTTKLDELPELWNVVCGEMSLVGPRPEVPRYVSLENPLWQQVLRSKPGISDPVTLLLRNEEELLARAADRAEMFYVDILQPWKLRGYAAYLERRTIASDVEVLWRSILAVLYPTNMPPPSIDELSVRGPEARSHRSNMNVKQPRSSEPPSLHDRG